MTKYLSRLWNTATSLRTLAGLYVVVGLLTVIAGLFTPLRILQGAAIAEGFRYATTTAVTVVGIGLGVLLIALTPSVRRGHNIVWWLSTATLIGLLVTRPIEVWSSIEVLLTALALVLTLAAKRRFVAIGRPLGWAGIVRVAALAFLTAWALGLLYLTWDSHTPRAAPFDDKLTQAILGTVGIPGPLKFETTADEHRAMVVLAVLGLGAVLAILFVAIRPRGGPHELTADEEQRLRRIIAEEKHSDSLDYFALRDDRSIIGPSHGRSAVSYRVLYHVTLAGGDPLGPPAAWPEAIAAWLAEARRYGWIPAVIGASERGAAAYRKAGMKVVEIGDEAVIEVADFTLAGQDMKSVRQAVNRVTKAGLQVSCMPMATVTSQHVAELEAELTTWRGTSAPERGFSMALSRFGDPRDAEALLVTARNAEGELRGLLHLVPWPGNGYSLDRMQRHPDAANGTVEAMVAGVVQYTKDTGGQRISLNFAVFRAVFERGERLGAGPIARSQRGILLGMSRFWQLEALYRSNAKYKPDWHPRYLAYAHVTDVNRVLFATLRAEGLLPFD